MNVYSLMKKKKMKSVENGPTFLVDIYINPFSLTLWPCGEARGSLVHSGTLSPFH